jgi:hypothetical protein
VIAHAQKPDFVFRRNGRVHLIRRGASVQSTTDSRGVRINGGNAVYNMFQGSVKSTGYPLHSPVSPSLPVSCVTVCYHISTGLYPRVFWKGNQLPIHTASYPRRMQFSATPLRKPRSSQHVSLGYSGGFL